MAALDIIKIRAPQYQNTEGLSDLIAIATAQTGPFPETEISTTLGTTKDLAIALRTLHMIVRNEVRAANQTGGIATSISEGSLSVGLSISPEDQLRYPDLCTTVWGMELVQLIKTSFVGVTNRMIAWPVTTDE
jgi:hypothetical protein